MKENDVIKLTKKPLTKSDLIKFFKKIGIQSDDILVVHSALSQIGYVIGGAQSVIEALLEVLQDGTLIMPAHSGDLSNPEDFENPPIPEEWIDIFKENMPAFDPELTPLRGMGKIANQFMALKNTQRSNHPIVSFCAYGKHADYITKNHPLTPMFGMESPLGKVYALNGKILMLGAPLSTCSAFHVAEYLSGVVSKTTEEAPILKHGKRQWVTYEDIEYDEDDFLSIGNTLKAKHIIKTYRLPLGEANIMNAKAAIDGASEIIKKTRKNANKND